MPITRVRSPSGDVVSVEHPEGASEDEIIAYAQRNAAPKVEAKPAKPEWADLPGNILPSAGRFFGGLAEAVTSPVQTAKALYKLGTTPPEELAASPIGQFYKERFGGLENLKQTAITDPVGMAADASLLLGIGGAAAPGVTGKALSAASKYTNPLSVIPPVVKGVGAVGKQVLGLTTMQGPENLAQAAKAGRTANPEFWANLTGNESRVTVLEKAKQALANMRADRGADYRANIAATAANQTPLSFQPIDQALANVVDSMKYAGKWTIGKEELPKIRELENVVRQWRVDPTLHTPMGLDALKRRIDAIYPASMQHEHVQRAVTQTRNAVKDTIVQQSPEYAKTMKAYEEALSIEREIERALSLGSKAAEDTALRKLQSLARNNVNANYGHRLELANALEKQGGVSLMPSLAGQSMNTWTSRGLGGQVGQLGLLGVGSLGTPAALGLLPFTSPKAVGAALYGGGLATGAAERGLTRLGVTPSRARLGLLSAERLKELEEEEE